MPHAELEGLTLAPLDAPDVAIARGKTVGGQASAHVDAGSIIAFTAGIEAQVKEDVLYSMQLAQRAASGVADRYKAVADWYREYSRVLAMAGWVLQGFAPAEQKAAEGEYEVAKAALKIIAAAATGPQSAVLTAAISALEGLSDEDGFITLFEHYGFDGKVGNFQVGAVEQGAGGELSMGLGAFQMTVSERKRKILFVKWREKDVTVWADAQKATFNPAHYAILRDQVRGMLGDDAKKAIASLPLAKLK